MNDESRIVFESHAEKKRRAPDSWKKFFLKWAVIAGFLSAGSGTMYALWHPELAVDRFSINETRRLKTHDVAAAAEKFLAGRYAYIAPKNSFFLADTAAIETNLRRIFPEIRNIAIHKEFPDTLNIAITERAFWGILCPVAAPQGIAQNLELPAANNDAGAATTTPVAQDTTAALDEWMPLPAGNCVFVDKTGFAYRRSPAATGNILRKIYTDAGNADIGIQTIDPARMDDIRAILASFKARGNNTVVSFYILSYLPNEIRVVLSDGIVLYLNQSADYHAVADIFYAILKQEIGERRNDVTYVDLRFGNKVFYRLRQ